MICYELKQTIFAGGGLRLLQIVSKLDTGWCASKDVERERRIKHLLKPSVF